MNYVPYHVHSDLSNGVTNIDSVTKFGDYVKLAKSLGMSAMAFSEHGSVFEFFHKKQAIESAGMKYIHAAEFYMTMDIETKIRDNYHIILIARNYYGFLELNKLCTKSFNRKDNHFYYVPRISFEELSNTSKDIIVTTACIGSVFGRGSDESKLKMIEFLIKNKDRCFLEIQHHDVSYQRDYNLKMLALSKRYDIPLIAGTDTHALNELHAKGRLKLQVGKRVFFEGEDNWDLSFKNYDQLVESYRQQNTLEESVYLTAIENTNLMASMVAPFSLDMSNKYPIIYDNPLPIFERKIEEAVKNHPYIHKRYSDEQIQNKIDEELKAYVKTGSVEFMLLQNYLREWERENGIQCGYSRGSVSGSFIAYVLGITQMDSIKFDLNFFRFINPDRVSLADIDTDYGKEDRDKVKRFLLENNMGLPKLHASEIITFNTIVLKGAIRDIGRAFDMPLEIVDKISKTSDDEVQLAKYREKYKEMFEYVDIVQGTIVSVGSHPSGVLISDLDIESTVGMCSSSTSEYPVSMLNMKELDGLNYVKLDILGLDNIALINKTCEMVGIEHLTPDNVDLNDMKVWQSIIDSTVTIFQWESPSASNYLSNFMSKETLEKAREVIPDFSMIKWLSFGNGLIRPGCASFRDDVAKGIVYDTGMEEINKFMSKTFAHPTMQEDVITFLIKFCGYSPSEADLVRRKISKKGGTEQLLPEIESRFIKFVHNEYGTPKDHAKKVIQSFLKVIEDASAYMFSWNHSDSYSIIGYVCGYLRYYYPLEFLTVALNVFTGDDDKTALITGYAQKIGIKILRPKFRFSKSDYIMDKKTNSIYKGLSSIKNMSASTANDLEKLYEKEYSCFTDVLYDLSVNTCANKTQTDILIKVGFFEEFGNVAELIRIYENFAFFSYGSSKIIKKANVTDENILNIVQLHSTETEKQYRLISTEDILREIEVYSKSLNIKEYPIGVRIKFQKELLGYVDLSTQKPEDLRKLAILEIEPKLTKDKKKTWAYSLTTSSLGSGKKSELMVMSRAFDANPVNKFDVIEVREECLQKKVSGKYTNWYLSGYTVLPPVK